MSRDTSPIRIDYNKVAHAHSRSAPAKVKVERTLLAQDTIPFFLGDFFYFRFLRPNVPTTLSCCYQTGDILRKLTNPLTSCRTQYIISKKWQVMSFPSRGVFCLSPNSSHGTQEGILTYCRSTNRNEKFPALKDRSKTSTRRSILLDIVIQGARSVQLILLRISSFRKWSENQYQKNWKWYISLISLTQEQTHFYKHSWANEREE